MNHGCLEFTFLNFCTFFTLGVNNEVRKIENEMYAIISFVYLVAQQTFKFVLLLILILVFNIEIFTM